MQNQLSTLSPIVSIHNNKVITTSLDIAKCFIKRHDNVLRCISNLDCSPEFTALNFELSTYTDCTGRNLPVYNITRDGFIFLVTGFTGKKAAQFKEAYINAFNEMEKALLTKQLPKIEPEHSYRYHVEITITDRLFGNNRATIKTEAKDLNSMITGFAKVLGFKINSMSIADEAFKDFYNTSLL